MKKLALLLAVVSANASAQDYTMTPGKPLTINETGANPKVFGFDAENVYTIDVDTKGKGTNFFLTKTKMTESTPVYSNQLPIADDERSQAQFLVKDKIMVFTKKYDPASKQLQLWVRQYDATNGKENGSMQLMSSVGSDGIGNKGMNFFTVLSLDESKLLIVSEFQWKAKPQDVKADVYDAVTLKKISSAKLLDVFNAWPIESNNYVVDNEGAVSYLFNYSSENGAKTKLGLGRVNAGQTTGTGLDLSTINTMKMGERIEISDCKLNVTDDNGLVIGGVFMDVLSKEDKQAGMEANVGIYTAFVDGAKSTVKAQNLDYFTDDVKTKLTYTDGVIKNRPAQKEYKYYGANTLNGVTYTVFTQHSWTTEGQEFEKEVLVARYDKDGKQSWLRIIPRAISSAGSFSYLLSSNGFYVFYDEKKECMESNTLEKYDPKCYNYTIKFKPTAPVYTYIGNDGKMSRKETKAADDFYTVKGLYYRSDSKRNLSYMKMQNPKTKQFRYDLLKVN